MIKFLFLFLLYLPFLSQGQFDNKQAEKVDIIKYDFKIHIHDRTDTIQGQANIFFVLKKPVKQLVLNFKNKNPQGKGMQVLKVLDSKGEDLIYHHKNNLLTINVEDLSTKQDTFKISIKYAGIPEDGLYIKTNKYGNRTFFGDNWPNRAQYWLPVIDHPSDKALVSWHILAPKHYKIIASGILKRVISQTHYNRYDFATKVPLPTKVMVFGAADFNIKFFDPLYLTNKCVPVSSWLYQNSPLTGFDDYKCSLKILKFYDSLIGPYAFEKLANVQSNTRFGGMENAGNIFYDENTVDGTKSAENLVAHEVAHQWFGNAVSEKNWRDIWLSEGFATYLTDVYIEKNYGQEKANKRLKQERQKIIRYNRFSKLPIVYQEQKNLFKLLNPNSYEKAAWVLHMLRQQVGDPVFFKILHQFYRQYYLKNAGTEDFIQLAEQISGQKLDWFFDQWIYRPGIPKLKFDKKFATNNHQLILKISQTGQVYQLKIPIHLSDGKMKVKKTVLLKKKTQSFHFKLPENMTLKNLKLIIDPNATLLFENEN